MRYINSLLLYLLLLTELSICCSF